MMYAGGIVMLHPQSKQPIMLEGRYVVMNPMLDPNTFRLYQDQSGRPMMEIPMTEKESG